MRGLRCTGNRWIGRCDIGGARGRHYIGVIGIITGRWRARVRRRRGSRVLTQNTSDLDDNGGSGSGSKEFQVVTVIAGDGRTVVNVEMIAR